MSSVLHPVGPEGRGTYWRRRLVAILALVVVVVLVALGVRALTTSDDAAAQQPTRLDPSTVATSPSPSSTDPSASPGASPTDSATGTPTESATASPGGPCEPSALTLTLTSNTTTYGPGKTPKFTLTVKNTSTTTCTAEIGSAVRTFTASDAGGAQVWASTDCQAETASQVYDIEPDKTRSMSIVWSRLTSGAGCPDGQRAVDDGNYTINGSWNDVAAQPVTVAFTG